MPEPHPGLVILFGSGETSLMGGRIFEAAVSRLPRAPRLAVLETPAGFELNSAQVAGRIADVLRQRLQNYRPEVVTIPARKRGTPFSPDNQEIIQPLFQSQLIFLGPGSPTYTVRHLKDTLAWRVLAARHRLGAAITFASAATVAAGAWTLPVYEIYKAGEDLHWREGLDFFGAYGLSLAVIPHWNNAEGGVNVDTSRCFMGRARFEALRALLPAEAIVVGIDEYTGLIIDFDAAQCKVMGHGKVTVIRAGQEERFVARQSFPLTALGPYRPIEPAAGIPAEVWQEVLAVEVAAAAQPQAPPAVMALVEAREAARAHREWATADDIRRQIAALGWSVLDTPAGPRLESM